MNGEYHDIAARDAAAVKRARHDPAAVAALVDACEWLDAALASIVEAGVKAGAFADPLHVRAWPVPWRAVHARQSLLFQAMARRYGPGGAEFVNAAHSRAALLDTLASLESEPGGPSLLALVVEGGSPPRPMRPAVAPAPMVPRPRLAPASSAAIASQPATDAPPPSPEVRPVVQLLADVRAVFAANGDPKRIASAVLDRALHALPERPWGAMPKTGKPITVQARGRMLAAVGVRAKTLEFDGKDAKGYERAAFRAAWKALL